ncbi:hypothetical protein BFP72_14980 [Reichenbachiella sp. 5M10]|uniref:hypothetical protein n=1 Tax=Reichenbachiella sp. 5M10 TaxID=1889772 RepID=UPI000C150FBB|nr:hypothetical protein [Reichenbachiella sp. 5M10]PIB36611.1 hypothetical protein BFP72_14980 [Reichenbachiella sp. 5M10]
MKQPVSILVFIYNSYKDPLFQNLILSYIKTLSQNGSYRFDLITFEQPQYALSPSERRQEKESLKEWGIHWHPRQFQTGRFLLIKKAMNVLETFWSVLRIKIRHKSTYTFAFANVSAAIAILFSPLLRMKLVIYSYEPHSDFMVEMGHWKTSSIKYKILHKLEQWAGKYADHILTGTRHMVEKLQKEGTRATVHRAPTAVDPEIFRFDEAKRKQIRHELNIGSRHLFIYPGKLGGLYYEKELIDLFGSIYEEDSNSFFLIATDYDHKTIESWFQESNIPSDNYQVREFIPFTEMPAYLSASDMGIVAIPPTPSQKFRSPTKVAEYLLCGLPYVVCRGVSEDDNIAEEKQVGVCLDEFSSMAITKHIQDIQEVILKHTRTQNREIGLAYRSKLRIDHILKDTFI